MVIQEFTRFLVGGNGRRSPPVTVKGSDGFRRTPRFPLTVLKHCRYPIVCHLWFSDHLKFWLKHTDIVVITNYLIDPLVDLYFAFSTSKR
jgi:hypothetical protein